MKKVLKPVCKISSVYIDDIIVSDNWSKHLVDLKSVLCCLKEAGLVVKLRKCVFGKIELSWSSSGGCKS